MGNNTLKRMKYIDSIKGFAIICVVLGHVAYGYMGSGTDRVCYSTIYNIVYAFHMPLFFVISGLLFGRAYTKTGIEKERINKQMFNLICLYFIYSLLLGTTKILFGEYVNNQVTVKDLFLIPIKPIQLYWYIYLLTIYYFIFSWVLTSGQKSAFIIIMALLLGIISYWIPAGWFFDIKRLLYYLPFFYLGIILDKQEKLLEKPGWLALFLLILLLFSLFWSHEKMLNSIFFLNMILGITCSLFFLACFKQIVVLGENRILSFIGKYSLEIYLLHTFILTLSRALFHKLSIENPVVIVLLSTTAGVMVPIVVSVVCKKLKLYNYLFSPYKRNQNASNTTH